MAAGHVASAQVKVAVVNLQKAVFDTAEIKKADTEMQARYKPRQDKLLQLQDSMQRIAQQLQTGGDKLTQQAQLDLQTQGQTLQRQAQRLQEELQTDVQADRNEILSKSSQKMSDILKKLAEEKGVDLIVDSATTLYFKPTMELTGDATAAYNKAYPVK
jgi:outer membrane protein